MVDFSKVAGRPVRNVKQFLRDSADNGIKYIAERGAKHQIYIPYKVTVIDQATGETTKDLVAISEFFHDIVPEADKYESTICLDGKVIQSEDGETLINDGTCPFCGRVSDGWDIRKYRLAKEEASCGLTGERLADHMKDVGKQFNSERKVKEKTAYVYVLIVKFKLMEDGKTPVFGADGLPDYELKVAKWSASRVEKIQETLENSMIEMEGAEIVFKYGDSDDRRQWVSGATTAPLHGEAKLTFKHKGLLEKIDADVAKWDWAGLDKSFKEWNGYSTSEASAKCNDLFKAWDSYKADLGTVNEHEYLESSKDVAASNPSLTTQANTPVGIGVQIPVNTPGAAQGAQMGAGQTAQMGAAQGATQGAANFDPNVMFGANANGAGFPDLG